MIGVPRRVAPILALSAALVLSTNPAEHANALRPSAGGQPMLEQAISPDPFPRVVGTRWPSSTRIALTVSFHRRTAHTHLHSTRAGRFGVEIRGVSWCAGLRLAARDAAGHRAELRATSTSSSCSRPTGDMAIVVHVLTVHQMQAKQINLDVSQPVPPRAVHVGDVLYLYQPGDGDPRLLLLPDQEHFRLIDHGAIGPCPAAANCPPPPGSFWTLAVVQAGDAIVTVSHACRQSTPPCMLPDRAIRIAILP